MLVKKLILFLTISSLPSFVLAQKNFVVVELFTSEGCSSCPPADELLTKVSEQAKATNQNVIPLAFHVDYWNNRGWKDPYSKFQFTTRQENYSRILAEKQVYTPQAVINGKISFTGSKEVVMNEQIQSALKIPADAEVELKIDSTGNDTLYVSYSISKSGSGVNYSLRFALTEDGLTSKIGSGENAGKTLEHNNVVRLFTSVDSPLEAGTNKIPLKGLKPDQRFRLTAFIQHKQSMKIIGAKRIKLF